MNIRDFVGIVRELSFSEIRQESMIPPRLLIISATRYEGAEWRSRLFGEDGATFVELVDQTDRSVDPLAYDVILSIGNPGVERTREWADLFRRAKEEMIIVEVERSHSTEESALEGLRRQICDIRRDRSVAFGRYMDKMRAAATAEIVSDTSRVNAQFAAASNIPALVPVVGGIFAAGADFLVLTKNQLMMMYRLAAIYDRDLDHRFRVYTELAPVVGVGLVWRTAARQIAAVLPFALGAIPKVTIAFAGTYAIGQAARTYYEHGYKLSSDELDDVYRDAISKLGSMRHRITGRPQETREDQAIVLSPGTGEN